MYIIRKNIFVYKIASLFWFLKITYSGKMSRTVVFITSRENGANKVIK